MNSDLIITNQYLVQPKLCGMDRKVNIHQADDEVNVSNALMACTGMLRGCNAFVICAQTVARQWPLLKCQTVSKENNTCRAMLRCTDSTV